MKGKEGMEDVYAHLGHESRVFVSFRAVYALQRCVGEASPP